MYEQSLHACRLDMLRMNDILEQETETCMFHRLNLTGLESWANGSFTLRVEAVRYAASLHGTDYMREIVRVRNRWYVVLVERQTE